MMEKTIKYIAASLLLVVLTACSEDKIGLSDSGNITGTAVTLGDNEPLENVKVSSNPSSDVVFTDAQGNFTLTDVPIGSYSVQAEKEGFLTQFEGVTVIADVNTNVIFELDVATANNRPPNTPILVTPIDNATDIEIEVDLHWIGSDPDEDDELIYTVELRNDQNSDIELFEEIADTTYRLTGLTYGTKYFWQVMASDEINDPITSAVSSFETLQFPSNRFLFVRKIGGNNVIFSSDEDGNELQLTSSSVNSWRPRKANTIDKIAFLRSNGGDTQLYKMNPDGSEVQQLTYNIPVAGFNLEELDFSWRFNDANLVYPNFDKLYRINANGGSATQIYSTPDGSLISEADWNSNGTKIALKTNDVNGYNVQIYVIDTSGTLLNMVLTGVTGAAGGLHWSVDSNKLLYTYDVSGFEDPTYRRLDSRMFIYDFGLATATDISSGKEAGTNDLDPKFSPNEAEVIFVNTSNDGVSQNDVYLMTLSDETRGMQFSDAKMPDYK